jgi:hypothetical protein
MSGKKECFLVSDLKFVKPNFGSWQHCLIYFTAQVITRAGIVNNADLYTANFKISKFKYEIKERFF